MASRGGFPAPQMNPTVSPMNVGHIAGMRMPGMPQPPAGYPRSMTSTPQYHQRSGMPPSRLGGLIGSMGGQMPGPSYGGGSIPMRPGMGHPGMDASRKRFLQQQQQEALGGLRRG
ncbi:PREDICTED: SWI/SNF-related matrix-associated actin-dependent regulator of chromatin subfamily D member 1-like [Poecilia mexicana]|nr:PREDICTED: SWI/SNF-related matrix-associated actin-dependent regulator of chromatin subfamily D member 1-like [Poecilia mexicana]